MKNLIAPGTRKLSTHTGSLGRIARLRRPRVVFDSNVLCDLFVGLPDAKNLVHQSLLHCEIFASDYIYGETRAALIAKQEASRSQIMRFVTKEIPFHVRNVTPAGVPLDHCEDPGDCPVLGTAVAARAHFLFTRDKHLLKLGKYFGTNILHPSQVEAILPENFAHALSV